MPKRFKVYFTEYATGEEGITDYMAYNVEMVWEMFHFDFGESAGIDYVIEEK